MDNGVPDPWPTIHRLAKLFGLKDREYLWRPERVADAVETALVDRSRLQKFWRAEMDRVRQELHEQEERDRVTQEARDWHRG